MTKNAIRFYESDALFGIYSAQGGNSKKKKKKKEKYEENGTVCLLLG